MSFSKTTMTPFPPDRLRVPDVPEMNLRPGRHSVEVVQPKNEKALIAATIVPRAFRFGSGSIARTVLWLG